MAFGSSSEDINIIYDQIQRNQISTALIVNDYNFMITTISNEVLNHQSHKIFLQILLYKQFSIKQFWR